MNRRKPPLRLAVVPMAQLPPDLGDAAMHWFSPFLAGYLMGYARQVALKHGIDCEDGAVGGLAAELGRQLVVLPEIKISTMQITGGEAGYLAGRLEALCGSRHLAGQALMRACLSDKADAGLAFLTDCDNAADPMQSRAPTLSLRFTPQERAVFLAGFADLGQRNTTEIIT